jgi:hypothetical protein
MVDIVRALTAGGKNIYTGSVGDTEITDGVNAGDILLIGSNGKRFNGVSWDQIITSGAAHVLLTDTGEYIATEAQTVNTSAGLASAATHAAAGATRVLIQAIDQPINLSFSGAATTTTGVRITTDAASWIVAVGTLADMQVIKSGATNAAVQLTYFK